MSHAVTQLLTILDLERIEENIFRGRSPQVGWQRVFGGLVVAQALVASARTVEERAPHSLHGYFLLPGDPSVPIVYEVDRIRDGKSFTTRRCNAIQHGRAIFSLSASFQIEEPGLEHAVTMPKVPLPEDLPSEIRNPEALWCLDAGPHSPLVRPRPPHRNPSRRSWPLCPARNWRPRKYVWLRATGPLPSDPAIHRAVLAYLSDMTLLDAALGAHGHSVFDAGLQVASLDHALWFHRPFRADDWLLYAQDSPNSCGARGFARGLLFSHDGRLVASVAQEGLMRPKLGAGPKGAVCSERPHRAGLRCAYSSAGFKKWPFSWPNSGLKPTASRPYAGPRAGNWPRWAACSHQESMAALSEARPCSRPRACAFRAALWREPFHVVRLKVEASRKAT